MKKYLALIAPAIFFLPSLTAQAAPVLVYTTSTVQASAANCILTIPTMTAGNLGVFTWYSAGAGITGNVFDSAGDMWTQAAYISNPINNAVQISYAMLAGGTNVQASTTFSATHTRMCTYMEFSGLAATPLDVTSSFAGPNATTLITSGTSTTSADGELIVGVGGAQTAGTITPGTSFTIPAAASGSRVYSEYMVQSTAGAISAWARTTVNNSSSTGAMATFKVPSSAPAASTPPRKPQAIVFNW